jgi:hypothetical protein
MGVSAKAILFGDISREQVAAVIREAFPVTASDMRMDFRNDDGYGNIIFPDPGPVAAGDATHRKLFFMAANTVHDYEEVYSGTRTTIDLSAWGSSTEILTAVLQRFGGFLLKSDAKSSSDPDNWERFDAPRDGFEAANPKDRLKIELAGSLPFALSTQLAALADDSQSLDKVLAAFLKYKKEQAIVDELEVDTAEPEIDYNGAGEAYVTWNFAAGPTVDIALTWALPNDEFNAVVRTAPDSMSETNKTEQAPKWLIETLKQNVSDNPAETFATVGRQVIEELPTQQLPDEMIAKVDKFLESTNALYASIPGPKI